MRADEPRVTIRLGARDFEVLSREAIRRGVKLGTLIREAAVAEASRGRASFGGEESEVVVESPSRVEARVFVDGLRERYGGAGVVSARDVALARQARLNEARGRS